MLIYSHVTHTRADDSQAGELADRNDQDRVVRDNMVSRRIMCMRDLYPCPNWDCISEGIISKWAGGREAGWRRSFKQVDETTAGMSGGWANRSTDMRTGDGSAELRQG